MIRVVSLVVSVAALGACTSNGQRIDRTASDAQLSRRVVTGTGYRHVIYLKDIDAAALGNSGGRMLVFLEGDGRPWIDDGRQRLPAVDPTTRNPIALQLLARTNAPGIYISRPCYQGLADRKCSSDTWTGGRYSREVVESLAAAVHTVAEETGAREIVLVGYSGGGALAVLVAERTEKVAAVVTLGANLDIEAWTQEHRYLPLSTSLNPAASDREHPWRELHLSGALDTVVPTATTAGYFEKYPAAKHWIMAQYDHVCCWVNDWPEVFARIQKELE